MPNEIKNKPYAQLATASLRRASHLLTQLIQETSAEEKPSTTPRHEQIQIDSAKDGQTFATTVPLPSEIVDMQCMLLRCSDLLNQIHLLTTTQNKEGYDSCVAMSVELDKWWDKIQTQNGQTTDNPYHHHVEKIKNTLGKTLIHARITQIKPDVCMKDQGRKNNISTSVQQQLMKNLRQALQIYENSVRQATSNHNTIHRNLVQTLNNIMPRQLSSAGTSLTASPYPPTNRASHVSQSTNRGSSHQNKRFNNTRKWHLESAYLHAGCQLSQQDTTLLHLVEENQKIYDTHLEKYMEADGIDNPTITCDNIWTIFCPPNSFEHRKKVTNELKEALSTFAIQAQKQIQDDSLQTSPRSVTDSKNQLLLPPARKTRG